MSHSVIISPASVFSGQRITIRVDGLDVGGGESYDFGVIKDGVTVYGYDPSSSPFVQELTGPVSLTCAYAWLGGAEDVLLTVRAYISGSGQAEDTADAVFRLRKGNQVIPYTIDEDVAKLPVSGWLPHDTVRNNLYRLMMAYGVNIVKGPDGNPHFTALRAAETAGIDTDSLFLGGSVEHIKPYAAVSVLEHTYTALIDANPVTLFDNTKDTAPITNKEVWFDQAPVIVETLTATAGLSIAIATENSAILTGQGVLTGVPYTHSTQTNRREYAGGECGKTASVNDNTMVSVINGDNLVNRLFAYYCADQGIEKIRTDLVYDRQRCGKLYHFKSPFGENKTAFLASADLNTSSFVRGACELIAGYTPAGQAGLYDEAEDITQPGEDEGEWTVPEGVTSFRVILIGGGTGGSSGLPGESGKETGTYTNISDDTDISGMWYGGEGGDGGAPGEGGSPGRVKIVTIENAVPGTTYRWTRGKGGEGGAALAPAAEGEEAVSNPGSAGTASTFTGPSGTVYSTDDADAYVPEAGVYDPINGAWYALRGSAGIRGGKGGARKVGADGYFAWTTDGEDVTGPDGTVYHGGRTGTPMTAVDGLPECRLTAYGGNGAGAAVGVDRADHPEMDGKSDQTATWEVVSDGV